MQSSNPEDGVIAQLEQEALDQILNVPKSLFSGPRPTAASLGLTDTIDECDLKEGRSIRLRVGIANCNDNTII